MLGDGGGEGDDVVADFGFDLVDAGDGEVAVVADGVGGGLRDEAEAGEGLRGGGLDGEPAAVLVLVGPDAAHGRACVAGDHRVRFEVQVRGESQIRGFFASLRMTSTTNMGNYTPKRADISSWRKPWPGR